MRQYVALIALFAMVPAQAESFRCGPKDARPRLSKPVVIQLNQEARKSPAYYARVNHLVMFFKPEDVLEVVRARAKGAGENNNRIAAEEEAFATAITAELPLKQNTDLFKYSFLKSSFGWSAEYVIDNLLNQGRASIGDWGFFGDELNPKLDHAEFILRASQFVQSGEMARWYCTEYGATLFSTRYIMY